MDEWLKDAWLIKLPENPEPIAEYGSSQQFGIPDPESVTAYDSEGEEFILPKCEKCGQYKSPLIGKEAMMFICLMGCDNESRL